MSSHGKRRLIRGEGFATRISSNVRPQDPGGGTPTLAAPRRMTDIDVTDAPDLSGGTPTLAAPERMTDIDVTDAPDLPGGGGGAQSVPSRISVMLVEEAIAGGTPRLGCPRDEQSERQPA